MSKKDKKYPQINTDLPIRRIWTIFYIVILMIGVTCSHHLKKWGLLAKIC